MVQHCHLEIVNPPQRRPTPEIQFDSTEEEIITSEIVHQLELGVQQCNINMKPLSLS